MKQQQKTNQFVIEVDKTKMAPPKKPPEDYSTYCLTEEEIWKIYDQTMSSEDKAIFLLLYHSALRDMEVANLRVEDINMERSELILSRYKSDKRHPKNKTDLTVPISAKCLDHLRIVKGKRTTGWLFSGLTPSRHINEKTINHKLARFAEAAGVKNPIPITKVQRFRNGNPEEYHRYKNVNPHLLRHSGIRHYLDKGGDIRMAQRLARHSSIDITMRIYGTPSVQKRMDEFKRIVG